MKRGECINERLTAQQFRLSAIKVNGYQLHRAGWFEFNESHENCELRENNEFSSGIFVFFFFFLHEMSLTRSSWPQYILFLRTPNTMRTRWTRYMVFRFRFACAKLTPLKQWNWKTIKEKWATSSTFAVVVCLAWLHARFLFMTRNSLKRSILISSSGDFFFYQIPLPNTQPQQQQQ